MLKFGKIEISGGFLLTAALLLYLDEQGVFFWALLACVLHEWGHYTAVKLMGGQVSCLRLTPVGGEMILFRRHILSYGRELFTVLAGPGVNIGMAILLANFLTDEWAMLFAGLNLVIGFFNLMPVYPLDGGRALRLLLTTIWSPGAADRITLTAGLLVEGVLMCGGAALLWKTGSNFTLLITAVWLMAGMLRDKGFGRSGRGKNLRKYWRKY